MQSGTETILVVDDEQGILEAYRNYLAPVERKAIISSRKSPAPNAGFHEIKVDDVAYNLLVAGSGEAAIELVNKEVSAGKRVAAGFFDMRMPGGVDGLETIQRIRELDKDILCAIVTADQDRPLEELRRIFPNRERDEWDYIAKPFTKNEVCQKARNMVATWRRRRDEEARSVDRDRMLSFLATLAKFTPVSDEAWFNMVLENILAFSCSTEGVLVEVPDFDDPRTSAWAGLPSGGERDLSRRVMNLYDSGEFEGFLYSRGDLTVLRVQGTRSDPFLLGFLRPRLNESRRELLQMTAQALAAELDKRRLHAILERTNESLEKTVSLRTSELQHANSLLSLQADELRESLMELEKTKKYVIHQEKLAAVGQLAAGVAHEINNPATYLLNNLSELQILVDRINSLADLFSKPISAVEVIEWYKTSGVKEIMAYAPELVRESMKGIERITRLAKDLRSFARAPIGVVDHVDISEVLDQVLRMLGNSIRQGIAFSRDYDRGLVGLMDRDKIGQVFLNLIENAVHALNSSERVDKRLRVSAHMTPTHVVVLIEDNAGGIPSHLLDRVFEPFFTTKEAGRGTGLGLPISRDIVVSHGGDIKLESQEGTGTKAVVQIPRQSTLFNLKRSEPAASDAARIAPRSFGRILIVDDDARVLKTITRLVSPDYDVTEAGSAFEVMQILGKDRDFDVILCDLMMQGVNGSQLFAMVQKRWPELDRRFLFIWGGVVTPEMEDFLGEIEDRLLAKPLHREDLLRRLEQLSRRAAQA